jgi:hypothetical protein
METADEIKAQLVQLVRLIAEADSQIGMVLQTDDVIKLDEAASEARSLLLEASDIAQRFLRRASGTPEPELGD